ncbi:MAG: hypothetical protein RIT26_1605 [Pseudomonadota bacterium]|jgi:hypothetical protein
MKLTTDKEMSSFRLTGLLVQCTDSRDGVSDRIMEQADLMLLESPNDQTPVCPP